MTKKVLVLILLAVGSLWAGSFDRGMQYFIKGKHAKALPHFIKASNQGHKEAQFYLANMYEKGLGVKKDKKKAVELFKLYSNKQRIKANINLSTLPKQRIIKKTQTQQVQTKITPASTPKRKQQYSKRYKKYYNPELQGAEEVHFN